MGYLGEQGGRLPDLPSNDGSVGDPRRDAGLWTFAQVEERLQEGMAFWWRSPDRERGWLWLRAFWVEFRRHNHFGDYADTEAEPRQLPLTRDEIRRRDEVSEWLALVPERDRRLVAMVTAARARDVRVTWPEIRRMLAVKMTTQGLGQRYGRAIGGIATALNKAVTAKMAENRRGSGQEGKCGG